MKPNNPFLISGYYSSEYFCDRAEESGVILSALSNGRDLTLVSPRRMGKTGLIKHVFDKLKKEDNRIVTLYMDIFATQNIGDFVRLFATTVLGKLDSAPQKVFNSISQILRSCRPSLTFDEFSGTPKVLLDIAPATEAATLKEIFEYLRTSGKECVIAIDEFQQISEYPDEGVEALLRSFIQFTPNVHFIFAGSKQHVIQEMFLFAKRPFYQSTQILSLGSIQSDAYYEFATNFFERRGITLSRYIFDAIYEKFAGHTWYIQNMLNRLYGYNVTVDRNLVEYAISEIVAENSYAYESLMEAYTSNSVKLLKAIASEGCVAEPMSGDFVAKYKLRAPSSVNANLKKLIDKELIYKSAGAYIIYDRFMAEWLRRQAY